MDPNLDILMVGHYAKDKLIVDDKSMICAGGAVYYGSIVLRRLGLKVGVATRGAEADYSLMDEMRDLDIDIDVKPADQSSGCINIYHSDDMERRVCKLFGFAGEIPFEDIPHVTPKIIMVTPIIAGEITLPTLIKLSEIAPIALDVQGFVRVPEGDDLNFRPWKDMEEGLKHVTYLKVDRAEAEHMTGETDLAKAAKILAAYGPKEILLTQTTGVTVYTDGVFYEGSFTPKNLSGRTGRGDTCFTSYVGSRLKFGPERAAKVAGIVTSMKQEKHGPWSGWVDPMRYDPLIVYGK